MSPACPDEAGGRSAVQPTIRETSVPQPDFRFLQEQLQRMERQVGLLLDIRDRERKNRSCNCQRSRGSVLTPNNQSQSSATFKD